MRSRHLRASSPDQDKDDMILMGPGSGLCQGVTSVALSSSHSLRPGGGGVTRQRAHAFIICFCKAGCVGPAGNPLEQTAGSMSTSCCICCRALEQRAEGRTCDACTAESGFPDVKRVKVMRGACECSEIRRERQLCEGTVTQSIFPRSKYFCKLLIFSL